MKLPIAEGGMSDLAALIRHAELFGTELVYETALPLWRDRLPPPVDLTRLLPAEREALLDERERIIAEVRREIRRDARRLRVELDRIDAAAKQGRYSIGRKRRRSRAESQAAILLLLEDGLSRREIADKLGLSVRTVDFYLTPKERRATADLGSGIRRHKTPANEGVKTGGSRPPELGSTMRVA